ncbi:flagellar hook-basal body complex protein [Azospirillum melinis]
MSLNNILNIGVTGLTAQSQVLNVLSDNIANSSTTGYKASDSQFSALVTGGDPVQASGVRASSRLLTDAAGSLTQTGIDTNAAIAGAGFFAVTAVDSTTGLPASIGTAGSGDPELTRAGDFQQDAFGHLVNGSGRALMAIPVNPDNPQGSSAGHSAADLRLVALDKVQGYHAPTSTVSLTATLPAGLSPSTSPGTDSSVAATLSVVDDTGRTGSVELRFMKTADNPDGTSAWTVYRTAASNGDGSAAGSASDNDPASWQSLGTLTFAADGTLAGGPTGSPASLPMNAVGNLPAMSLDLGTYGATADGLTVAQGAAGVGATISNLGQSNDGIASGSLQSVDLTADGFVRGTFAGGKTRDFYRVPDVTVANPTDLEAQSGTAYRVTDRSGAMTLRDFGTGSGSGASLTAGAVEGSNVSIENQFTTMITAQRAYSASSKVVTTGDEMTQTVIGLLG